MKRVAIVSLTIPEMPGKSGGEIRDIYMFQYLGEHYETDYFSIHNYFGADEIEAEFAEKFNQLCYPRYIAEQCHEWVDDEVHLSILDKIRLKLMRKDIYLPGMDIQTEAIGFRNEFNRYIKRYFQHCVEKEEYDYVVISPQVNPAIVEDIKYPEKTKVIWATYDIEVVRHERLRQTKESAWKRFLYKNEMRGACALEKKAVQESHGIIAVSELDKSLFVKHYGVDKEKVLAIENGVDTDYFYGMKTENNFNIVFVGNMGYAPNEEATKYFIKEVFPLVLKSESRACFYAVGANASEALKKLQAGNVFITGRVDDVREYIQKAYIICVPLLSGSGTKYKVLEAMACQKAVITTDVGAEGIDVADGENIIIADGADEIANKILESFSNQEQVERIGEKAREFILQKHDWQVVLPKINSWFEEL